MNLPEAALELRELRSIEETHKQHYQLAKEKREQHERKLIENMEAASVDGLKVDGINFVPTKTIYPTVQDRSAFLAWAEENDPSLVELKERKQQIGELVRERLDNGEPPPPGLGFYVKEYISQRAA